MPHNAIDKQLGFRAWNQYIRRYVEGISVKISYPNDVLQRLVLDPSDDHPAQGCQLVFAKWTLIICV
jgi:hypothetical protein